MSIALAFLAGFIVVQAVGFRFRGSCREMVVRELIGLVAVVIAVIAGSL